jgi:hypothetical protein
MPASKMRRHSIVGKAKSTVNTLLPFNRFGDEQGGRCQTVREWRLSPSEDLGGLRWAMLGKGQNGSSGTRRSNQLKADEQRVLLKFLLTRALINRR